MGRTHSSNLFIFWNLLVLSCCLSPSCRKESQNCSPSSPVFLDFFFPQKRNESKVCYPYIIVVISIWSNYDILSSLTLCPQIILGKGESQNHTFSVFWAFSWVLKGQYFMEICICICNIPIFFFIWLFWVRLKNCKDKQEYALKLFQLVKILIVMRQL